MKKTLSLLILFVMMFVVACGGSADDNANNPDGSGPISVDPERTYTFWLYAGSKFYIGYDENPVVEYAETLPWGEDAGGNPQYIDIEPFVPVSGSETDSFNTLLGTGDYMDVMDMSGTTSRAIDLYQEGVALDITEYVESYMPNYRAFLEANPNLQAISTDLIDGEPRYVQLYVFEDELPDMWGGFHYRRDWIVKYGTHPEDGSTFSGEFTATREDGTPDPDSWEDNVVFPSGGAHPVYISDWEWMFEIFDRALEDLGATDGYAMSLYYPGYLQLGDLVSSFGGGGPSWYKTADNEVKFGGTSDTFRTYLQAMNTWYENGWIDRAFAEHSTDQFFTIDPTRLFSGKVGLWWGSGSGLGARLSNPDVPTLDGYVAFTAAQPINDIYGDAAQQNVIPDTTYQTSQQSVSFIVTAAAAEKDMETLFTFLDYFYGDEGAVLRTFGLSETQYETTQNEFMTDNGYTAGAYTTIEDAGETTYQLQPEVLALGHDAAINMERLPGLRLGSKVSETSFHPGYYENLDRFTQYEATGTVPDIFRNSLSEDDFQTFNGIEVSINEFMIRYVPPFVRGEQDPYDDDDWNAFVNALNKYEPETVLELFQPIADNLYE